MGIINMFIKIVMITSIIFITNCTTLSDVSQNVTSKLSDPAGEKVVQTVPRDELCKTCVMRNYRNVDGLAECNYLCAKEKLTQSDCRCMQRHLKEDNNFQAFQECEEQCRPAVN